MRLRLEGGHGGEVHAQVLDGALWLAGEPLCPFDRLDDLRIVDALEGPVALTDCAAGHGHCCIEETCRVGRAWQRLSHAIRRSLHEVTLAQLAGLDSAPLRVPSLEREVKAVGTPRIVNRT